MIVSGSVEVVRAAGGQSVVLGHIRAVGHPIAAAVGEALIDAGARALR